MRYAVFWSIARTPRKSSVAPPSPRSRFQFFPSSIERSTTPFEPDAQTTGLGVLPGISVHAALTPRRFVSIPLVWIFQFCASPVGATANRRTKLFKGLNIPPILTMFAALSFRRWSQILVELVFAFVGIAYARRSVNSDL